MKKLLVLALTIVPLPLHCSRATPGFISTLGATSIVGIIGYSLKRHVFTPFTDKECATLEKQIDARRAFIAYWPNQHEQLQTERRTLNDMHAYFKRYCACKPAFANCRAATLSNTAHEPLQSSEK